MNKLIYPAAKRTYTGDRNTIAYEIPRDQVDTTWAFLRYERAKGRLYQHVIISRPRVPRTTGWKSQNHHFRGHCRDIIKQTGNSMSDIATAIKERAVEFFGYPEDEIFGKMKPRSEANTDIVECGLLIEAAHHFAAEWNYYLIESEEDDGLH